MVRLLASAWVALSMLWACTPSLTFTPRGRARTARPASCTFELMSGRSARAYDVIGVIDLDAFDVREIPKDDASFRALIAREVCRAGADAVLPGIDGNGRYVLATLVAWTDGGAQAVTDPKTQRGGG